MNKILGATILVSLISICESQADPKCNVSLTTTLDASHNNEPKELNPADLEHFYDETLNWLKFIGFSHSVAEDVKTNISVAYQIKTSTESPFCSNIEFEKTCSVNVKKQVGDVATDYKASKTICVKYGQEALVAEFDPSDRALEDVILGCRENNESSFTLDNNYTLRGPKSTFDQSPSDLSLNPVKSAKYIYDTSEHFIDAEIEGDDGVTENRKIILPKEITKLTTFHFNLPYPYKSLERYFKITQFFPIDAERDIYFLSLRKVSPIQLTTGDSDAVSNLEMLQYPSNSLENDRALSFVFGINESESPYLIYRNAVIRKVRYWNSDFVDYAFTWANPSPFEIRIPYKIASVSGYSYIPYSHELSGWLKVDRDSGSLVVHKFNPESAKLEISSQLDAKPLPIQKFPQSERIIFDRAFVAGSSWVGYKWRIRTEYEALSSQKFLFFNYESGQTFLLRDLFSDIEGHVDWKDPDFLNPHIEFHQEYRPVNQSETIFRIGDRFVFVLGDRYLKGFSSDELKVRGVNATPYTAANLQNLYDGETQRLYIDKALNENTFLAVKSQRQPPGTHVSNWQRVKSSVIVLKIDKNGNLHHKTIVEDIRDYAPGLVFYSSSLSFQNGIFKFRIASKPSIQSKTNFSDHEVDLNSLR